MTLNQIILLLEVNRGTDDSVTIGTKQEDLLELRKLKLIDKVNPNAYRITYNGLKLVESIKNICDLYKP